MALLQNSAPGANANPAIALRHAAAYQCGGTTSTYEYSPAAHEWGHTPQSGGTTTTHPKQRTARCWGMAGDLPSPSVSRGIGCSSRGQLHLYQPEIATEKPPQHELKWLCV
jgi:hypothetical protein